MRCKNRKEDEDNMKKASIAKIAIYIFLILLALHSTILRQSFSI